MKKRPPTSTTRHGSGIPAGGAGWGGPARGGERRPAYTAETQPTPEAKAAGHAEAKTLREMLSPHKQRVADTWLSILQDPDAPAAARVTAGEKIALFAGESPAQKSSLELTGKDGAALIPTLAVTIRNE